MKNLFFLFNIFVGLGATLSAQNILLEKPIVVVILAYNNKKWCQKTLESVFSQNYHNYRVIYIDDCSTDGSAKLAKEYIENQAQKDKVTFIQNKSNMSVMANHYKAVYMCNDDEIVTHLDGDDWLYDTEVFNTINEAYSKNDIWVSYGTLIMSLNGGPIPTAWLNAYSSLVNLSGQPIFPVVDNKQILNYIKNNNFRANKWHYTHLRTFYAWLFKHIKLEDLMYKSSFKAMKAGRDRAIMYPLVEMAGYHQQLISKILYVYNISNPLNIVHTVNMNDINKIVKSIASWKPYLPLQDAQRNISTKYLNKKADIIILTTNIHLLPSFIKSLYTLVKNFNNIFVVYDSTDSNQFDKLKLSYPPIKFISYNSTNSITSNIANILALTGDYVILSNNNIKINQTLDLSYCIYELERTFAYGFYFHLYYNEALSQLCAPLSKNIIAWQPYYTKHVWPNPDTIGMILYRKKDIKAKISNLKSNTIDQFIVSWPQIVPQERTVGLFFKEQATNRCEININESEQ